MLIESLLFAIEAHGTQKRKDAEGTAYIVHPVDVLNILKNVGITDENILCAAVLHDVIEDTKYGYDDIVRITNKQVADYVAEVTDDKSLAKDQRKLIQIETMSDKSVGAKLIKIADKISNIKSIIDAPPVDWNTERKKNYFDWAKQVVDQGRGINIELETLFDNIYNMRDKL